MPVLKTLVETPLKSRFQSMARARGLSESEFLRLIVLTLADQCEDVDQPVLPDAKQADTDRMTVRMPRFLHEAVKVRAKSKGMAPSRWVAALVQSHLTRQPVMTDDELAVLLSSNRELAAIGRNINQIARALNEAFHETERVRIEKLAELTVLIDANRAAIRGLVRASQNAWEADDVD
jgi:predicted HicB family RNase H-like nuclease